jgi:hypothetical protein
MVRDDRGDKADVRAWNNELASRMMQLGANGRSTLPQGDGATLVMVMALSRWIQRKRTMKARV